MTDNIENSPINPTSPDINSRRKMNRRTFLKESLASAMTPLLPNFIQMLAKINPSDVSGLDPVEVSATQREGQIEMLEVETVADLEEIFRKLDERILPPGSDNIHTLDETTIRMHRQKKGLIDGPFSTTIVMSKTFADLIKTHGAETIGTDDPQLYFLATNKLWQEWCAQAGAPNNDLIKRMGLAQLTAK